MNYMLSKNFLINEIKKIFKKELGIKVSIKNKIYDHAKWDSLGNFNVLLKCEKYFNIKLTNKEFTNTKSFKEILKIVQKK